mmetsp:Transcript_20190/g.80596  ORF Transcript_20190/g.80596 Transcript_20190/m.80596 type:complete len:211 (+) Transcript_20190:376-1008(+)
MATSLVRIWGAAISSMTWSRPSLSFCDNTTRIARRRSCRFIDCAQSRSVGPCALPDPLRLGERLFPMRAWPVPFCGRILRPDPRLSLRVLAGRDGGRQFARCHLTYRLRRSRRSGSRKMACGSEKTPASSVSKSRRTGTTGSVSSSATEAAAGAGGSSHLGGRNGSTSVSSCSIDSASVKFGSTDTGGPRTCRRFAAARLLAASLASRGN